jgi:hypothetical protein
MAGCADEPGTAGRQNQRPKVSTSVTRQISIFETNEKKGRPPPSSKDIRPVATRRHLTVFSRRAVRLLFRSHFWIQSSTQTISMRFNNLSFTVRSLQKWSPSGNSIGHGKRIHLNTTEQNGTSLAPSSVSSQQSACRGPRAFLS